MDLAANTPASHAVNLILTLTNAASKTWSSNVNFTVTAADGTYAITGVFGRQASLLITAAKANYL